MPFYQSFKNSILLCLFFFVFTTSVSMASEYKIPKLLTPGDTAPTNSLKDALSKNDTIFPEIGKWNVIFYWSLFCHSCLEEIPGIQQRLPESQEFNVYYVSLDSERMEKGLVNFAKKRRITHPLLMEKLENNKYFTADQWGVSATPAVFITDPEGKITFAQSGPMDLDKFFSDFESARLSKQESGKK